MKPEHWRIYEPIPVVAMAKERNATSAPTALHVFADLGDDQEVGIVIDGLGLVALRLDQLDTLIGQLQTARRDVSAAAEQPPIAATGTEGRCESCSQLVRAGEPIVIDDAETEDRVVLHAGPCPDAVRAAAAPAGSN